MTKGLQPGGGANAGVLPCQGYYVHPYAMFLLVAFFSLFFFLNDSLKGKSMSKKQGC